MSICHDKKLIFIHIPKNAGTSVFHYFKSDIKDILPDRFWIDYLNHFKKYWDSYLKFSIVRNPICRFKSIYRYLNYKKDINEFAKYIFKNYGNTGELLTIPQYKYICSNNKIIVDKIIRYENLNEDLKELDIHDFPHKNKSRKVSENKLNMNEETLDIIFSLYEKDFKILNYDFKY